MRKMGESGESGFGWSQRRSFVWSRKLLYVMALWKIVSRIFAACAKVAA